MGAGRGADLNDGKTKQDESDTNRYIPVLDGRIGSENLLST
jgi:hypothetical protein